MRQVRTLYLFPALAITTAAVCASFIWRQQEHALAYRLDRTGQTDQTEIHRTNLLWLGLWGGA